jgi:hypothetical protein
MASQDENRSLSSGSLGLFTVCGFLTDKQTFELQY